MTASLPAEKVNIDDFVCVCGHDGAEHDYQSIPGNWVCGATDCDCQGFEAAEDDEWDGDENRE